MRHRKRTLKLGRTSAHNRCMLANMLKSLIDNGRIQTTVAKAKELRRHADKMITLAKANTLASRRLAISKLMIRYNTLTPKQKRQGEGRGYNLDRTVITKLFDTLGARFATRQGGYTRIVRLPQRRIGDDAASCFIEFLQD